MISQGAVLDNVGTAASGFSGGWSDYQYFSDGYIHSGADTYVCSKDYCGICCNDPLRLLDVK